MSITATPGFRPTTGLQRAERIETKPTQSTPPPPSSTPEPAADRTPASQEQVEASRSRANAADLLARARFGFDEGVPCRGKNPKPAPAPPKPPPVPKPRPDGSITELADHGVDPLLLQGLLRPTGL